MNSEHIWRMRVAHWFAAMIGASLVAIVALTFLTGAPVSTFGVVAIAALLTIFMAYILVGAKFLSNQPSPNASVARTIRLVGWIVVAGIALLATFTLLPLVLVDNSITNVMPGGTALIILLLTMAIALAILVVVFSKWLGTLKELEERRRALE